MLISRTMESLLVRRAREYPVVFLTGPRQSGKSTLCRMAFPEYQYISLEDLQERAEASEDPRGFLRRFEGAGGVVLDEVQRVPSLFSYLQGFVDDHRGGPFILTGSQQFLLNERIAQTLAGRAAILELLPFSIAELAGRKAATPESLASLPKDVQGTRPRALRSAQWNVDLFAVLLNGFFPPIHDRAIEAAPWLDAYLRTYVERDVRTLGSVGDLDGFVRFLALCAGRAASLVNLSSLGADAGITHPTAARWLSILRAAYVVELLPAYHRNFNKRITRSPKLHFHDTGLLCHLLGIRDVEQLRTHPLRGMVFENLVVAEVRKLFLNSGQRPPLFFWRDSRGREVDIVVDLGTRCVPVEVKSGETVAADFLAGLDYFMGLAGVAGGILVYGGDKTYLRRDHQVRSWRHLT